MNLQMAGATIVIVPMLIFFLVFRKQIIAGVARGGIRVKILPGLPGFE